MQARKTSRKGKSSSRVAAVPGTNSRMVSTLCSRATRMRSGSKACSASLSEGVCLALVPARKKRRSWRSLLGWTGSNEAGAACFASDVSSGVAMLSPGDGDLGTSLSSALRRAMAGHGGSDVQRLWPTAWLLEWEPSAFAVACSVVSVVGGALACEIVLASNGIRNRPHRPRRSQRKSLYCGPRCSSMPTTFLVLVNICHEWLDFIRE